MDGSNFITIGYNFLQLTVNSIDEMKKQGNHTVIFSKTGYSTDKAWESYEKQTCWNDQNIGIPVLFNFFHGVELILKGLIIHCGGEFRTKNHSLIKLLSLLKETPNPPAANVIEHFNEILTNNGFESFFANHKLTVDSYYQIFKYPELRNQLEIKFWEIRGKGKNGLKKFERIKDLATGIKSEIIEWKKVTI
jgi:HEPN domain-containing protein